MGFVKADVSTTQSVTANQVTKILSYSFSDNPTLFDLSAMVTDAMGEFSNSPNTVCFDVDGAPLLIVVQALESPS
jgi:hypothetical protein